MFAVNDKPKNTTMKKYYAIGAVVALGLLSGGAQAEVTAAPVVAEASHPAAEAFRAKVMEILGTMDEMTTLLKGVTDKETADAAVAPMIALCERLEALNAEGEQLEDQCPDFDETAAYDALSAEIKPLLEQKLMNLVVQMMRIGEAQAYGSDAFLRSVRDLNLW